MRRDQKGIRNETNDHNKNTVNAQSKRQITQQAPPEITIKMSLARNIPLRLSTLVLIFVVFILNKTLVVRGFRVRDLVVEQPRQNEGNCRGSRATNISQYFLQTGNGHGGDEGEDDEDGGDDCEFQVAHLAALGRAWFGRVVHQCVS